VHWSLVDCSSNIVFSFFYQFIKLNYCEKILIQSQAREIISPRQLQKFPLPVRITITEYNCWICSKSYKFDCGLSRHSNAHKGCSFDCTCKFTRHDNLKCHQTTGTCDSKVYEPNTAFSQYSKCEDSTDDHIKSIVMYLQARKNDITT
jgi:hypothetical protein